MDFKPIIFIGSSKEGFSVAKIFATGLAHIADVTLWTDAFEYNKSNYDNLISQIALFDYAVLIATADDVVTSRSQSFSAARDNVLLEFGFFAGGLGRSRVFYVVEKDVKIPSDLAGITLPFIVGKTDPAFNSKIEKCIDGMKSHIRGKEKTYDLGFLPSTALAYGYFVNFVERTVQRLLEDKEDKKVFHLQDGRRFSIVSLKMTILIPNDLGDDMFKKVKAKKIREGWHKLKVEPKDIRDYDFSIDISKADEGLLHLVDIPLTLNALNKAMELYSQKAHLGKDQRELLLEKKEIRNFKRTLEYLIDRSAITRDIVVIEIVDI